jgi:hypothetical protein
MTCQDRTGFLFAHACDRLAAWKCGSCAKEVCDDHMRREGAATLCASCWKKSVPPPQPGVAAQAPIFYNDPFWYSHYHYNAYPYYDLDDYRVFHRRSSSSSPSRSYEGDPQGT